MACYSNPTTVEDILEMRQWLLAHSDPFVCKSGNMIQYDEYGYRKCRCEDCKQANERYEDMIEKENK